MTNEVAIKPSPETEMMEVLRASLYPGARLESVRMVMAYCRAQRLDPFSKPVHLVPINVKEGENWVTRDVIMPGIVLYRIRAERTGHFLGSSEPEYGPTLQLDFKDKNGKEQTIDFPEWCRVTVKKLVGDRETEWTSREFWLENYQTAGRNTDAPNEMWCKRAWGQIAKCAEAQALRKAFPDAVGAEPTFEERGIDDAAGALAPPSPEPVAAEPTKEVEAPKTRSDAVLERARKPRRDDDRAPTRTEALATQVAEQLDRDLLATAVFEQPALIGTNWPEAIYPVETLAKMPLGELNAAAAQLGLEPVDIDEDAKETAVLLARSVMVKRLQACYEGQAMDALRAWVTDLVSKFAECTVSEFDKLIQEAVRVCAALHVLNDKAAIDVIKTAKNAAKARLKLSESAQ